MQISRRNFLESAGFAAAGLVPARRAVSSAIQNAAGDNGWRVFELTTRVEVLKPVGATRIWLPTAFLGRTNFQRTIANEFKAEGWAAKLVRQRADGLGIVAAEFPAKAKPVITLTSRAATKDYTVDLRAPGKASKAERAELDYFRRPTKLIPTDGIVRAKADEITKGETTDAGKARAIYEWIVDNTFRNPKTRGCGTGNIRFMLESGDLGGKCADLNALYVGLARAAGLPARDFYGIRVAKSGLGYKSLGAASEVITKAQHCRAEVYLSEYGWVPVDPADVRKVVLEEPPGNRALSDPMVTAARARLFGSWEMNWIAFNSAHDVALPGSNRTPPEGFFMYPHAETADGRLDALDPEAFRYEIRAREITRG